MSIFPKGAQSARRPALAGILLFASLGHVHAQEDVYELPPIILSASVAPSAAEDLTVSATTIDRAQIENSPATTIDDVLRQVPGVQLPLGSSNQNFPANPSVSIRGLGLGDNGTRTLVLVDGIPANGGFFGNVYWNAVPLSRVERIEVVRGGSGPFGAYAMGGTINIITRKPEAQASGRVDLRAGSFDTGAVSLDASTPLGERVRLGLHASYEESDGYNRVVPAQRGTIDKAAGYTNRNYGADLFVDLTDSATGFLRFNHCNQDQNGQTAINVTETELNDLNGGLDIAFGNDDRLSVRAFFRDESFETFNGRALPGRNAEFLTFTSLSETDDYGASAIYTRAFDGVLSSVSLGVDLRQVEGTNDAQTFDALGTLLIDESTDATLTNIGILGEMRFVPSDRSEILVNLRHDSFDNHDASGMLNGAPVAIASKDFDETSLRLSGRFDLTDELALRGVFYRAFRAPTLAELYRSFGTSTFRGLSNPNLDPETMLGGELGLDFFKSTGLRLSATAFCSETEDFVGSTAVAFFPVFTLQNTNLGKVRSQGIELDATIPLGPRVDLRLGYACLDTEITSNPLNPTLVGNRIEGAPEYTITGGIDYRAPNGLRISLNGRHLTSQFQDASNTTKLDSHTVFDLSAAYPINDRFEVYAIGQNIFDEDYLASAFGGLNQRGVPAAVFVGLRGRF